MSRYEFDARLVAVGPERRWTGVTLPFLVPAVLGTRQRVRVRATVNGVPFASAIFPASDGAFFLPIRRQVRLAAGLSRGDVAHVVFEREPRAAPPAPVALH